MSDKLSDKMPELPDAACFAGQAAPESYAEDLYTADQLHAYARQYAQQWREDAERYRWLREHFRFASGSLHEIWFDSALEPDDAGVPGDLDHEIDAARAAREGKK